MLKNFKDFLAESQLSEETFETLEEKRKDYLQYLRDTDNEEEEIASVESGYEAIVKALKVSASEILYLSGESNRNFLKAFFPEDAQEAAYTMMGQDSPSVFISSSTPGKEIWQDEVWAGSPGSNQIDIYKLHEGKVTVCVWSGANWDSEEIYLSVPQFFEWLKSENRLREAVAFSSEFLGLLSKSQMISYAELEKFRGTIAGRKYGL